MLLPSKDQSRLVADPRLQDGQLRRLVNLVRDISFAFIPCLTIEQMVELGAGSCTPKHALLHKILQRQGIPSRLVWVTLKYDTSAYPYPDGLHLAAPGELYAHTSLQLQTSDGWRYLDVTFDRFLGDTFFVNHDLLLSSEPVPFGECVNLSVASDSLDQDARSQALGLPATVDPHVINDKRQRIKQLNRWLIDIRRAQFSVIREEYGELRKLLAEFLCEL